MKRNDSGDYQIKLTYHDLEDKIAVENVWAAKEGEYYRIKNVPFFAPNLAYNDLISVENDDGELFFDSLVQASGHNTIQIVIYNENELEEITKELVTLKCDWEGSHLKGYISVDVPKEIDYKKVKQYLENKFSEKKLDYKEACIAH
jgi:transcriptional regulator of heat shock response